VTERRFRRCGLIELADKGQNLFQRTGIRELRSLLMPTTMIVAPDSFDRADLETARAFVEQFGGAFYKTTGT
jgi:hypothetical protein